VCTRRSPAQFRRICDVIGLNLRVKVCIIQWLGIFIFQRIGRVFVEVPPLSLNTLDNIPLLRCSNGFTHFYNYLKFVSTFKYLPRYSYRFGLTYNSPTKLHIHLTYDLTKHCSSYSHLSACLNSRITGTCHSFSWKQDCSSSLRLYYTWKSTFLYIILAAVLEGMTLVTYLVVFNGGYVRKLNGWRVLSLLHLLIGIIHESVC